MKSSFLKRAKENLKAAELLFEAGLYNASANRAYYAAFHITLVLLWERGFDPKIDHKNVISLFNNEFINRQKVFPSKLSRIIYEIQNARNEADYRSGISKNAAHNQLKYAKQYFDTVLKEIEK